MAEIPRWITPNVSDYVAAGPLGKAILNTFTSLSQYLGGNDGSSGLNVSGTLTAGVLSVASTLTAGTSVTAPSLISTGTVSATGAITGSSSLTVTGAVRGGSFTTSGPIAGGSVTSGGSVIITAPQAGTSSKIQSLQVAGTTNGSGTIAFSFPFAFTVTPVVVAWLWGGLAGVLTDYSVTTTSFTVGVRDMTGALKASQSVIINYIAHGYV